MSKIDSLEKNNPMKDFELNITDIDTWGKKNSTIGEATIKLTGEKLKIERNEKIKKELEKASNNQDIKEILKNKKYEELDYRDVLALEDRGVDLKQLFLSKTDFGLGSELIVSTGNNNLINSKIDIRKIIPAEVKKIRVDGLDYIRTREGFMNTQADLVEDTGNTLLKLKDGQRIEIIEIKTKNELQEEDKNNKIIEDKLNKYYRKDKRFQDILLNRKFEDLTKGDLLNLKEKGMDLGELLLKDQFFSEGKDISVNFGKNTSLDDNMEPHFILPKEVREISINGIEYKRTVDGFFNPEAEEPYPTIHNNIKIKILKIDTKANDNEEKKNLKKQYKEIRRDEAKAIILDSIEKKSKKLNLPTKDVEDKKIFEETFTGLFGALLKFFEKIFKGDFFDLFGDNGDIAREIDGSEEDLKARKIMPLSRIRSLGIRRNPATGTTICSVSAREDAYKYFNLKLPRGNAIDVQNNYETTNKSFDNYGDNNFADVFIRSKSKYGHRLLGFRKGNEWYVLDPYTTHNNKEPIKLEEYQKNVCERCNMPITKVVFYKSDIKVV